MESRNFIEEIIEEDLASGKHTSIYTRFPPEPNGYLHIGHAKSLCINFGIKEKYNGKCNLRFDDTNPVKEDTEYVESIQEDIKWLGFQWDKLLYASDYFGQMFDLAVLLIKKGKAYVCDLSADEIKATRGTLTEPGVNSPYRERSVEENLKLFYEMRDGKYADGERVLRAKIDMASPNMNMRDPVIYRILRCPHHRTGDKWLIYPMYDFAHPLEDAIERITHSLCSLEFEDHRPLYDWFVENCEFDFPPRQIEFARLNIARTIMSKRYLKKLVDDGEVEGWSDPRMPTLAGMRERGYPPEAIRDFCGRVGVAKANSEVENGILEHCVRENLNLSAIRAMVVETPLKIIVENYPEGKSETVVLQNNPNNIGDGSHTHEFAREIYIDASDFSLNPPPKYYRLTVGGMIRLKGSYILEYSGLERGANGEITAVKCKYIEDSKEGGANAGIKVKGVVQWVNAKTAVPAVLYKYDYLLAEDGAARNKNSLEIVKGALAEDFLKDARPGERYQFIRMSYYVKSKENADGALRFNEIVSLKDGYKVKI